MWISWLIIIILLVIIEAATINLVSIWFIASALISLLLSFFVNSFYIQFGTFVVLGLILMILTRPILIKKFGKKGIKTNLDRVLGMEGIVTEEISKLKVGEVKVDGKRWSAISDELIKENTRVIVESIDGVKLVVRKGES